MKKYELILHDLEYKIKIKPIRRMIFYQVKMNSSKFMMPVVQQSANLFKFWKKKA
jgi:hypothetical protein